MVDPSESKSIPFNPELKSCTMYVIDEDEEELLKKNSTLEASQVESKLEDLEEKIWSIQGISAYGDTDSPTWHDFPILRLP